MQMPRDCRALYKRRRAFAARVRVCLAENNFGEGWELLHLLCREGRALGPIVPQLRCTSNLLQSSSRRRASSPPCRRAPHPHILQSKAWPLLQLWRGLPGAGVACTPAPVASRASCAPVRPRTFDCPLAVERCALAPCLPEPCWACGRNRCRAAARPILARLRCARSRPEGAVTPAVAQADPMARALSRTWR